MFSLIQWDQICHCGEVNLDEICLLDAGEAIWSCVLRVRKGHTVFRWRETQGCCVSGWAILQGKCWMKHEPVVSNTKASGFRANQISGFSPALVCRAPACFDKPTICQLCFYLWHANWCQTLCMTYRTWGYVKKKSLGIIICQPCTRRATSVFLGFVVPDLFWWVLINNSFPLCWETEQNILMFDTPM